MELTLTQDAGEKISITIDEATMVTELRKYFKWRKDVTYKRFNKLGTSQHDKFIKYLSMLGTFCNRIDIYEVGNYYFVKPTGKLALVKFPPVEGKQYAAHHREGT
jgi:hypothetical protein